MPFNETGKVIIHKGFGNSIIHPGGYYPGREVDVNGDYLPATPQAKEAPAQGASTPAPAKLPPEQWPTRDELEALNMEKLKAWASAQGLEFAARITKPSLLDLIDEHRPAPPAPPAPTESAPSPADSENQ